MSSMKLALFSDIHANLQALQACMDHARAQSDFPAAVAPTSTTRHGSASLTRRPRRRAAA